jgi:DNA polymerase III alpha subunit (gram-positive type)
LFLENYEDIENCIVVDTETVTDEITRMAKVWEIGIVKIEKGEIVDTKEYLIAPSAKFEKLDLWYPEDHISVEKIKNSPRFLDIYEKVEEYFHPENIICGHNIDYDIRVINQDLSSINKPLIGSKKIDTIRMAKFIHPDWTHYNLDAVCKEYCLEIEKRHRALDDAYATAVAFLKMREKILSGIIQNPKEIPMSLF